MSLRLQPALRSHVTFAYYQSGHAVYNNLEALVKLHADLDRLTGSEPEVVEHPHARLQRVRILAADVHSLAGRGEW